MIGVVHILASGETARPDLGIAIDDRRVEKTILRADQLFVSQSQVYVKCERRHIRNRWEPPR